MKSSSKPWDVVIVGAGAAGLMAAAAASSRGRRVLVLEKNPKLGVKILMSGGTRCNITHDCSVQAIATAFGQQGKFLHSALAALPPEEVIRLIEAQGVETKVESTGKIFPVSNSAIDVRDALVSIATMNVETEIVAAQPVVAVTVLPLKSSPESSPPARFSVQSKNLTVECQSLIITTGGKSYPGCGTTGDGYVWAEQLGHSIVRPVPALTPITCNQSWTNDLKGITIEDVELAIFETRTSNQKSDRKATSIVTRRGSFLFTHFGFSGPAVLDASRFVTSRPSVGGLSLSIDFLPDVTDGRLAEELRSLARQDGKLLFANSLSRWAPGQLPRRLAESLVRNAGIAGDQKNADLSKSQLLAIVDQIKRNRLSISGTLGFNKAEVTAGGIDLSEVHGKTMQSRRVPSLFFAGEILDLDGPIGGFNFQAAFSTGWLAGLHA